MLNVKEDLNDIINIINGVKFEDNKFKAKIYPFSNEILTQILKDFDFNDKKCLTVLGSSDQALDMYLRGASSITAFDINQFTKYYFYLKKAALLSKISLKEYINFFYPLYFPPDIFNKDSFNLKTFSKIVPYLSGDNLIFWSKLFDLFKPHDLSTSLLADDILNKNYLKSTIHYLKDDKYYELKEKIRDKDIEFKHSNVIDLPDNISSCFDYIYLSNIMQFIRNIYSEIKLKSYNDPILLKEYKKLVLKLAEKLNNNGKIMIMVWNEFSICSNDYSTSKKVFKEKVFKYTSIDKYEVGSFLQYTKK